jgi:hypothetical protein
VRTEQFERMQSLAEKLTDVVIDEANPDEWPGKDTKLIELTRDQRGDRYWCKKNAAATLSLLTKMHSLLGIVEKRNVDPPDEDEHDDLEDEIKAAEKEATKILKTVQDRVYERSRKS